MSLDKGSPISDPFGRISIFGNPFHGTVQGGVLSLPNSTTRAYPQPDGTWPDQAGSTHRVKRPGIAAVTRTTEQLAADDAAGRQWRNEAILSGGKQQLYGLDVEGWIYFDPDGVRWLVTFDADLDTDVFDFTEDLNLDINLTRFGEFGPAATPLNYSLTLSEWGQQGYPPLQGFRLEDGSFETVEAAHILLDAIASDGSRAALCIHRRRLVGEHSSDETADVAVRHPLGWVEIAISGPGASASISLTVLKDRDQTLEIVTQDVSDDRVPGTYPALIDPGASISTSTGSYSFEFEALRLAGCWWNDTEEDWSFLAMRYKHSGINSATMNSAGVTYSLDWESEVLNSIALEIDGVEQYVLETVRTDALSQIFRYQTVSDFAYINERTSDRAYTLDLDGVAYNITTDGTEEVFNPSAGPVPREIIGPSFYASTDMTPAVFRLLWRTLLWTAIVSPEPYSLAVDLNRHSSQVFSLRMQTLSGTVDEFRYWPRLSPSGESGDDEERAFSETERLYASWCPATGEVTDLDESPICWV